ncbi:MAG: c-type cytochrome [Armatimonadetes bacterium]|nr:c-type cytochrome [Armatimonadota bacterium]
MASWKNSLFLVASVVWFAGCTAEKPAEPAAPGGDKTASAPQTIPGPANAAVKGAKKTEAVDFVAVGLPILTKSCLGCHSGAGAKGGLDLSTIKTKEDATAMKEKLEKAASLVESRRMPPRQAPQLSAEERDHLVAALRGL